MRIGVGLGCVERQPFVGIWPASQTAAPGGLAIFQVLVLNIDDYGCDPRTFSLETYLPSGLLAYLGQSAMTLQPFHHATTQVWTLGPAPGSYEWALRVDGIEEATATLVVDDGS